MDVIEVHDKIEESLCDKEQAIDYASISAGFGENKVSSAQNQRLGRFAEITFVYTQCR